MPPIGGKGVDQDAQKAGMAQRQREKMEKEARDQAKLDAKAAAEKKEVARAAKEEREAKKAAKAAGGAKKAGGCGAAKADDGAAKLAVLEKVMPVVQASPVLHKPNYHIHHWPHPVSSLRLYELSANFN